MCSGWWVSFITFAYHNPNQNNHFKDSGDDLMKYEFNEVVKVEHLSSAQ